jgi:OOP family OmpA-OmpF porin
MRLLILFTVFVGDFLFAQNLVLNPSFEEYITCPYQYDQNGQFIDNSISNCRYWTGTNTSSDYYNACANILNPECGVPTDRGQTSKTGQAMSGILLLNGYGNNCREYLQTKFIHPLIQGSFYYINYYILPNKDCQLLINNIGAHFSISNFSTALCLSGVSLAPFSHQVIDYKNQIINDTDNWSKIEGIYVAQGGEFYLTLGNFSDDFSTDTLTNSEGFYPGAYYFFDDVSVEEITVPFWSYNDTLVNYGDSVLIGPALTGLDIDWYTDNIEFISNGPGIYVSPATSRNYIAKETFNGVETEHNVYVTVIGGVGLEETALQKIEVYPNPSKGDFSISGIKSESPFHLEVRDVHGKLVFENQNLSKEVNSFHLNVEDGIYFVNIINLNTHETSVKKLVVRK